MRTLMRTAGDSLQGLVCFLQLFDFVASGEKADQGFLPHVAAGFRRRAFSRLRNA